MCDTHINAEESVIAVIHLSFVSDLKKNILRQDTSKSRSLSGAAQRHNFLLYILALTECDVFSCVIANMIGVQNVCILLRQHCIY